jgi:ribonuclease P protein component
MPNDAQDFQPSHPLSKNEATIRYPHPKANRLGGRGTFKTILDRGVRCWQGPIGMAIAPSEARQSRLGISIGRPVGNAVRRNRIKRLLRESFRMMQHDWPRAYNVVILVKPHDVLTLAAYQKTLLDLRTRCVNKLNSPPGTSISRNAR